MWVFDLPPSPFLFDPSIRKKKARRRNRRKVEEEKIAETELVVEKKTTVSKQRVGKFQGTEVNVQKLKTPTSQIRNFLRDTRSFTSTKFTMYLAKQFQQKSKLE